MYYQSIDELGPEYKLSWPADLFRDEANEIVRLTHSEINQRGRILLVEAFDDEAVMREFTGLEQLSSPSFMSTSMTQQQLLFFLIEHADQLHNRTMGSSFWLQRRGLEAPAKDANEVSLQDEIVDTVEDLVGKGYFDKFAPRSCEHEPPTFRGSQSEQLDAAIERLLGVGGLWHDRRNSEWDLDCLFTFVEVLHDLCSRPTDWEYCDECGPHFKRFSMSRGQGVYRWKVNMVLAKHGTGLQLSASGENKGRLVRVIEDSRSELVDLVASEGPEENAQSVAHAVSLFERRGATREAKRSACVALARILEDRRKLIKKEFLKQDEGLLFEMANKFDLRHRGKDQHAEYGEEFLDWIYWIYLSTVELTDRILANQDVEIANTSMTAK